MFEFVQVVDLNMTRVVLVIENDSPHRIKFGHCRLNLSILTRKFTVRLQMILLLIASLLLYPIPRLRSQNLFILFVPPIDIVHHRDIDDPKAVHKFAHKLMQKLRS